MNEDFNKYDLLGLVLGKGDLQTFVDGVAASRYNLPKWKSYFAWDTMGISDSFDAMDVEVDLFPMASVIDADSPKPKRAVQGVSLYSGKIPKIGHGYDLTEQDLRNFLVILQNGGQLNPTQVLDIMFNTVNKLEFGAHARINNMTFMAMSTGHIILNASNNPDGGVLTDLDLRVPAANKKYAGFDAGVSAAWTDSSATPLTDLQNWVEWAEDNSIPHDIMRMSKSLWRTFSTHPNVVKDVRAYFANTNTTGGIIGRTQLLTYLQELGIPPIEIIDERSGLQVDGVTSNVTSWDESNISLSGAGRVGLVKNAQPISLPDPAVRTAFTEEGRVKIIEKYDSSRVIQGFEMECLAMPILSSAKQYSIMDTSKTTAWT